jgi:hypothetical protein
MLQRALVFLMVFLFLSIAFASTKLLNMWVEPGYKGKLTNILIVGITKPGMRQIWENIFVYELGKRGVKATSSYKLFPDSEGKLAKEKLQQVVSEGGYDGVILTSVVGVESGSKYVPGYGGARLFYGTLWGDYGTAYDYYTQLYGYEKDINIVRLQTSVWNTAPPSKVVWSATSEAVDVTSAINVSKDVSSSLMKELFSKKIL